ncbi:MAG: B12-binding domain-containing protein [Acidimicrobiia bacterium]
MPETSDNPSSLTLNEVAEALDVHYMTAYRYVRLGMLPAHKDGRSWMIDRDDFEAFQNGSAEPTERGDAPWDERLLARLLDGDDSGAWAVTEAAMASGMSVPDTYTQMLVPVLTRIGDLWEAGEIDVADEHMATRIAARIIARLGPRMARRGVRKGKVVFGSTQSELHSIAATIATDLVREAGFEVVDLGVNLPPDSFAKALQGATDLMAVGISVTMSGQVEEIRTTIDAVRGVTDAPIIVGGLGATEDLVDEANEVFITRDATELVALLGAIRTGQ